VRDKQLASYIAIAALALALLIPARMAGQQAPRGGQPQMPARGAQPPQGPQTGRALASTDLTGYWVSLITEDWRFRMMMPPKGVRNNFPLTPAGIAATNAWDPAKDEAAGEQCRAYGAVGAIRQPGRLHITWADDDTLKVETEAGTQTRLFHFGGAASRGAGTAPGVASAAAAAGASPAGSSPVESSWQGYSVAVWEYPGGRRGRGPIPQTGDLKVVTTRLRPGYLQKNGVPYSANAVLTEYFHKTPEPNGDTWLVVTAVVEDPQYLTQPHARSSNFKKLPDNFTGWDPEPCSSR
jgi:hypothetical protein